MFTPTLSSILGIAFAVVGAVTVWLMFHAAARMKNRGASERLVMGHRIGGYVFIVLFCVMTYYMVIRLADIPDELSARPMVHMMLAVIIMPLLFAKVLIARYYKSAYYSALMPLGLTIFSLGFVLVTITVGPFLLRRATVEDISLESVDMGSKTIDVDTAQALTQQRCARCHTLDRVVGARKDARGWLTTINRMRALPGASISANEGRTILAYLVSRVSVDTTTPKGEQSVGKALVDAKCARCHDLDRVYKTTKTADEWKATVARMEGYAPDGYFKPGERDEIARFLAETQTQDATQQRVAQTAKADAAPAAAAPAPIIDSGADSGAPGQSGYATFLVIAVASTVFGSMLIRRPGSPRAPASTAPAPAPAPARPAPAQPSGRATRTLTLARIDPQTHDAKTLRFRLPEGAPFQFKPGQFLTFNWIVDGKRVVRSYSICSSPAQSGYVEITVKRVPDGAVSVLLHDRTAVGFTVEAKGPSGKFIFDEAAHAKIVLLAAGSGITPVMSMLRYIDDRCLATDATLIYTVRTPRDVIFGRELEGMRARMPNFRYTVAVTQPDEGWSGPSGRLSRELLEANVPDPASATFFLCGPKPFMESARELLHGLGVGDDRILQESFGGPPAARATDAVSGGEAAPSEGRATFAQSDVSCDIPAGMTLLETAEIAGVAIPFSCRQGQCGTCATRLVDGEVAMDAEDGLDADLRSKGYVLTCVGRARGDVTLDA